MDYRNKWFYELGQRLGIPELAFDAEGLSQLLFDDHLAITIYKPAEAENLLLTSQLSVSNLPLNVLQEMLIANRSHSILSSPVLSLTDSLDKIQFYLKLGKAELDTGEDVLGHFLDNLHYWHTRLSQL